MLGELRRWADTRRIRAAPRIGAMATMPSRADSFARVLPMVAPQVERLYLYLDGFAHVPDVVGAHRNVVPLLAQEHEDLHAAGRFLPLRWLRRRSVYVVFDDDIVYPPGYVDAIVEGLASFAGRALVAYHGNVFRPPYRSYVRDRQCFHFAHPLAEDRPVHSIGAGVAAFDTARLSFDPADWPKGQGNDLQISIEAKRRGFPRIALAHPAGWLEAIGGVQPDSLYAAALKDDRVQSAMMRTLLDLPPDDAADAQAAAASALAQA